MSDDMVIYVLRPNGEALWLPVCVLEQIGAKHGDRLTEEQFRSEAVQKTISLRNGGKLTL